MKAQKAAHSKSLIWEPRVAASQSYQTLYTTCHQGFEELCQLDVRFTRFEATIFNVESQNQDRTQLSKDENEELDKQIDAFLRLVGGRLRLMPAIKAIEWLIRRFRYVCRFKSHHHTLTVAASTKKIRALWLRLSYLITRYPLSRLCFRFSQPRFPTNSAFSTLTSDPQPARRDPFWCIRLSIIPSSSLLCPNTHWSHVACNTSMQR